VCLLVFLLAISLVTAAQDDNQGQCEAAGNDWAYYFQDLDTQNPNCCGNDANERARNNPYVSSLKLCCEDSNTGTDHFVRKNNIQGIRTDGEQDEEVIALNDDIIYKYIHNPQGGILRSYLKLLRNGVMYAKVPVSTDDRPLPVTKWEDYMIIGRESGEDDFEFLQPSTSSSYIAWKKGWLDMGSCGGAGRITTTIAQTDDILFATIDRGSNMELCAYDLSGIGAVNYGMSVPTAKSSIFRHTYRDMEVLTMPGGYRVFFAREDKVMYYDVDVNFGAGTIDIDPVVTHDNHYDIRHLTSDDYGLIYAAETNRGAYPYVPGEVIVFDSNLGFKESITANDLNVFYLVRDIEYEDNWIYALDTNTDDNNPEVARFLAYECIGSSGTDEDTDAPTCTGAGHYWMNGPGDWKYPQEPGLYEENCCQDDILEKRFKAKWTPGGPAPYRSGASPYDPNFGNYEYHFNPCEDMNGQLSTQDCDPSDICFKQGAEPCSCLARNNCYDSGESKHFGGSQGYCDFGEWKDPDHRAVICVNKGHDWAAQGANEDYGEYSIANWNVYRNRVDGLDAEWNAGGFTDDQARLESALCCGDDGGEFAKRANDSTVVCCPDSGHTVFNNYTCGFSGTPENCTNNIDDDGDSYIDCADTDCNFLGSNEERCDPSTYEGPSVWGPGWIFRCAGWVDGSNATKYCCPINHFWNGTRCIKPEVCNSSNDEDVDGYVDCADSECQLPYVPEKNCYDNVQIESTCLIATDYCTRRDDELMHCSKVGTTGVCCKVGHTAEFDGVTWTCSAPPEECNNNIDDDEDGYTDCADTDCQQPYVNPGKDCLGNDQSALNCENPGYGDLCLAGDTLKYYCDIVDSNSKGVCCPLGLFAVYDGFNWVCTDVEICNNGIDDDSDGWIDCADPDCNEAEGGAPMQCDPASAEPRNYTKVIWGIPVNFTYYCSYQDDEATTPAYCCEMGFYWDPIAVQCKQAEHCPEVWINSDPYPLQSLRYNDIIPVPLQSPYDEVCCPAVRFGGYHYNAWTNAIIY